MTGKLTAAELLVPGTRFGEISEHPCPRDGKQLIYQFGIWICGGYEARHAGQTCGWSSERTADDGGSRLTLEKCPKCQAGVVYSGNYFCENLGSGCDWALPHPARKKADRELALRLTGDTR